MEFLVHSERKFRTTNLMTCIFSGLLFFFMCLSPQLPFGKYVHTYLVARDDVALARAKAIWKLDSHIGLKRAQLLKACRFIERLRKHSIKGPKIYTRRQTGVPCVIEKLTTVKGFLLRNLPGKLQIGRGYHKVVKKAVYYGQKPKIVAHCLTDQTGRSEINVLRQLRGARGIVPFLGSSSAGKNRYSIYLEYFSGGNLNKFIKRNHHFTSAQTIKIAKDIVSGLLAMHRRHLLHRDLHFGNILLKKDSKGAFHAALVDFGKTMNVHRTKKTDIPQVPQSRNPPESLVVPFSKINRYRADVYALGCNFYSMIWGEMPPWAYSFNVRRLSKMSYAKRKSLFSSICEKYKSLRKKRVGNLIQKVRHGGRLTPFQRFKILTMDMIQSDVHRRPPLSLVVRRMGKIYTLLH